MRNLLRRISADPVTEIDSSALLSLSYSEAANSNTTLRFGATAASSVKAKVRGLSDPVTDGEQLQYILVDDDENETLIATVYATAPTIASKVSYEFTAYDAISKLDVNMSEWLRASQDLFPMSLHDFAQAVCSQCGVTFVTDTFANDDYNVKAFYSDNLTGRQLLGYVAEIAGSFVRATVDGEIELVWYVANDSVQIAPTVKSPPAGKTRIAYYAGSLSYESYETAAVDRVQIRTTDNDVGVIYPPDATGNTYVMQSNIVLTGASGDELTTIATALLPIIDSVHYTPASFRTPRTELVRAGDILDVVDINGVEISTLAMSVNIASNGTSVSSDGAETYEASSVVALQTYSNIYGRMLTVEQNVDGLKVRNEDLSGDLAEIELTVDGINTTVIANKQTADEQAATLQATIEQNAQSVNIRFNDTDGALAELASDTDDRFSEIQSYIRATPLGVEIGRAGSDVTTSVDNDSFDVNVNGNAVATFGVDGATMPNATIPDGGSLTMGRFKWSPRTSGNLSLLYIGG